MRVFLKSSCLPPFGNCYLILEPVQLKNGPSHAATDQKRKAPISTAAADQARTNPGDCLDHLASRDLKRETPINGRAMATTTDTTLSTLKTAGNCDPAAAPHRAIPTANRIADAAHRPLLDCQRDTNLAIAVGAVKPKPPMPAAIIETAMTTSSLKLTPLGRRFLEPATIKSQGLKEALTCWSIIGGNGRPVCAGLSSGDDFGHLLAGCYNRMTHFIYRDLQLLSFYDFLTVSFLQPFDKMGCNNF